MDAHCLDVAEREDPMCPMTSKQVGCIIYPPDWDTVGVNGSFLTFKPGIEA